MPSVVIVGLVLTLFAIGFTDKADAATATVAQLQAETNARIAADTTEKNARITADNTEKSARVAADNTLKTQITAEQTARQAADTNLTTGLNNEKNMREKGDIAAATAYKKDLQAAVIQLQAQISALSALIPPPPVNTARPKQGLTLKLCPGSDTPQWETCPLAIGDTGPAGGIVFYVTKDGLHGLEAAPVDLGPMPWGCEGLSIADAASHALGSGAKNTAAILAACNEAGIAAQPADA